MTNDNIETMVNKEPQEKGSIFVGLFEDAKNIYKLHKELSEYGNNKKDNGDNYAGN